MAVNDNIGEEYITYRPLITVLYTNAPVTFSNDTVADDHIADTVYISEPIFMAQEREVMVQLLTVIFLQGPNS